MGDRLREYLASSVLAKTGNSWVRLADQKLKIIQSLKIGGKTSKSLVAVLGERNVKVGEFGHIFIRNPPEGFPRAVENAKVEKPKVEKPKIEKAKVEKVKVEKAKVERKGMNEIVADLNEIESQSRPEGGKLLDLLPMDSDLLDSEKDDRENISTNILKNLNYPLSSSSLEKREGSCSSSDQRKSDRDLLKKLFRLDEFQWTKSSLPSWGLLARSDISNFPNYGLLGCLTSSPPSPFICGDFVNPVYLNTHHPFCYVSMGVQGSGKSHSVATVIENCLLSNHGIHKSDRDLRTIIFHFDQTPTNFCEAVTLVCHNHVLEGSMKVIPKITVFTSPSNFIQRSRFYSGFSNCEVKPLLFKWSSLSADRIKSLMRVQADETMPLYMSTILDLLRKMQKSDKFPSFAGFKKAVSELDFAGQQRGSLQQRLNLLESFVAEAEENSNLEWCDLNGCDSVIIVDLTDPMISPQEANGIFQVVLSEFISCNYQKPKLIVFDEAHKYIGQKDDELSRTIVSIVRQMRHNGTRVVVSTQSPLVIPPELLELVTIAALHRFHSRDWFLFLKQKIPLEDEMFSRVMELPAGRALVFSATWSKSFGWKELGESLALEVLGKTEEEKEGEEERKEEEELLSEIEGKGEEEDFSFVREIQIRLRVTSDAGMTRV